MVRPGPPPGGYSVTTYRLPPVLMCCAQRCAVSSSSACRAGRGGFRPPRVGGAGARLRLAGVPGGLAGRADAIRGDRRAAARAVSAGLIPGRVFRLRSGGSAACGPPGPQGVGEPRTPRTRPHGRAAGRPPGPSDSGGPGASGGRQLCRIAARWCRTVRSDRMAAAAMNSAQTISAPRITPRIDGMPGTRRRTPFHMVRIVRQVPRTIPVSRTGRVMPVRPVPAVVLVPVAIGVTTARTRDCGDVVPPGDTAGPCGGAPPPRRP